MTSRWCHDDGLPAVHCLDSRLKSMTHYIWLILPPFALAEWFLGVRRASEAMFSRSGPKEFLFRLKPIYESNFFVWKISLVSNDEKVMFWKIGIQNVTFSWLNLSNDVLEINFLIHSNANREWNVADWNLQCNAH